MDIEKSVKQMADKWPSAVVSRSKIGEFTGGAIAPHTMANLDNKGEGPNGAFRMGLRSVVYPVDELCNWLIGRSTDVKPN